MKHTKGRRGFGDGTLCHISPLAIAGALHAYYVPTIKEYILRLISP